MRRCLLLLALLLPNLTLAAPNAGVVNGLWFSSDSFFAGETVRIYAAIYNSGDEDLSGTAVFYVNEDRISGSNFSVINGHLTETWADWLATEGEHEFSIELEEVTSSGPGGESKGVEIATNIPVVSKSVEAPPEPEPEEAIAEDDEPGVVVKTVTNIVNKISSIVPSGVSESISDKVPESVKSIGDSGLGRAVGAGASLASNVITTASDKGDEVSRVVVEKLEEKQVEHKESLQQAAVESGEEGGSGALGVVKGAALSAGVHLSRWWKIYLPLLLALLLLRWFYKRRDPDY